MKNLFTLVFIFFSVTVFAQNSNKDLNEMHQQIEKNRISLDSTMSALDSTMKRGAQYNDSMATVQRVELDTRNYTGLARMMDERNKKEKQRMWLRIGLGIAFLIIGIIGFTRRRKTKTTQ